MWNQTKGNETNATINQSQKDYFQKFQGCYNLKVILSISKLVALNHIEDTVEGMANIIRAASYAFKTLKDDYLSRCEKIYIPSTCKFIPRLRSDKNLEMYE